MHRGLSVHAFGRFFEGADTPFFDFIKINVEARLVELNNVTPIFGEFDRLLVQRFGEVRCQSTATPVMFVGKGVGGRHGTRQRDFHRLGGVAFEETQGVKHNRASAPYWSSDAGRVDQLIAVAAAPGGNLHQTAEVDPFYSFAKAPDVVPPALLTISDDI